MAKLRTKPRIKKKPPKRPAGPSPERRASDEKLKELQTRVSELEEAVVWMAANGVLAEAAQAAIRAQRTAGLPVTYQLGDEIVKEYPDGSREVIGTVDWPTYTPLKGVPHIRRKV